MKVSIQPTTEVISQEDVSLFLEYWTAEKKFKELKEQLVAKFKGGAKSPTLDSGTTLLYKYSTSKSTSYQKILGSIKEKLGNYAMEGDERAIQLLGLIEQWYMENTKEGERNVITPSVQQVVTVTKSVRIKKG